MYRRLVSLTQGGGDDPGLYIFAVLLPPVIIDRNSALTLMIQGWGILIQGCCVDTGMNIVTVLMPRVIIDSNSALTLMIQGWGILIKG